MWYNIIKEVDVMILKDLITQVPKEKVLKRLIEIYPDQKNCLPSYFKVYDKLLKLTPRKGEGKELLLMVLPTEDWFEEGIISNDVFGYCKEDKQHYALEFTDWDEWLAFEICDKSVEYYEPAGFLAHCLYEMTFVSFDEDDIQEEVDKLAEMEKEITEGTAITYSMEEVHEELGIKYTPPTEEEMQETREKYKRIQARNDEILRQFLSDED
jgi:hypothetical protein